MSFIIRRQRCGDCHKEWDAAFGVIGNSIAWKLLEQCPHCESMKISSRTIGDNEEPFPTYYVEAPNKRPLSSD